LDDKAQKPWLGGSRDSYCRPNQEKKKRNGRLGEKRRSGGAKKAWNTKGLTLFFPEEPQNPHKTVKKKKITTRGRKKAGGNRGMLVA